MTGAATAAVAILPLGDSITHGGNGDGGISYPTYRAWLYQDLRMLGYDVDFVGSLDKPDAPAGSDPDNEGHPAYTSGQILAELPAWLEAYPAPNIALVHLGTNDVLEGVPSARTVTDLTSIIGVLRSRNPSMTILVAQIIPTSVGSTNTAIEALNREIAGLATLSTVQSPVVIVDQYSGYDGDADNQEGGVHPLTSGEKKMAARWEGALFPVLARGVPTAVTHGTDCESDHRHHGADDDSDRDHGDSDADGHTPVRVQDLSDRPGPDPDPVRRRRLDPDRIDGIPHERFERLDRAHAAEDVLQAMVPGGPLERRAAVAPLTPPGTATAPPPARSASRGRGSPP